ncbi:unnamed protein product [Arabidopsis lyrata]|nr:unnamed protein product [Arabidopsis lyrata]
MFKGDLGFRNITKKPTALSGSDNYLKPYVKFLGRSAGQQLIIGKNK